MRRFCSMAGSGVLFLELGLGLGDIEAACSPSRPATPSAINTQVQYPGERRRLLTRRQLASHRRSCGGERFVAAECRADGANAM